MANRRASHDITRVREPRLRHGLAQINQPARPVLGVAPLDRCQLVQDLPSLALRGFREAVIHVGTAPLRGQQLANRLAGLRSHRDNARIHTDNSGVVWNHSRIELAYVMLLA
jgi:hypothetical protein